LRSESHGGGAWTLPAASLCAVSVSRIRRIAVRRRKQLQHWRGVAAGHCTFNCVAVRSAANDSNVSDAEVTGGAEQPQSLPVQGPSRKDTSTLQNSGLEGFRDYLLLNFLPRIDDGYLPFADILIAGVVAPSILVFLLTALKWVYVPAWLAGNITLRRGLLQPTLEHGIFLALCWFIGAVIADAYEAAAFNPRDLSEELHFTRVGGYIATLLLLSALTAKLVFTDAIPPTLGQCDMADRACLEADAKIFQLYFDKGLDIAVEAVVLTIWRLVRAASGQRPRRMPPRR